jgi:hypothetical protein
MNNPTPQLMLTKPSTDAFKHSLTAQGERESGFRKIKNPSGATTYDKPLNMLPKKLSA